jgi:orotate phosphoribosyltransferase
MPSTLSVSLLDRLRETGALLEGHFRLSSGRHSDRYVQCAQLLQYPRHAEAVCRDLAARIPTAVDVVVGPAMGGIVAAYEMARALGVRALFTERMDGAMVLRRGFRIAPGERVLVVEDVVTTGLSAREAMAAVQAAGGQVMAVASLIDRSEGSAPFDLPFVAAQELAITTFAAEACPLCAAGMAISKPGSRPASTPHASLAPAPVLAGKLQEERHS